MKKEKTIGFKVDTELNDWLRTYAKLHTKNKVSSTIMEALLFFQTYIRIKEHLRESLRRNVQRFGSDFASFSQWLKDNDRLSNYGGLLMTGLGWDSDSFENAERMRDQGYSFHNILTNYEIYIHNESFNFLRQWSEKAPDDREAFMKHVVLRYELWLRPENFTEMLDFNEAPQPAPAKAPKRKATVRHKAEARA